ncbi:MMPL family transporter [Aeoliella sp. SH292]|uniref:MMPL family transporter n=1 Tax=Aeoliella sp. SH292 TaxID=3454464 RepID=UPI003F969823
MFALLGNWVNRHWRLILIGWIVLAVGLKLVAPSWDKVALDGDFDYLPKDSTSRRGLTLLQEAFPDEKVKSTIVLVFARKEAPLTKPDRQFALDVATQLNGLGQDTFHNLDQLRELLRTKFKVDPEKVRLNSILQSAAVPPGDAAADPAAATTPNDSTLGLTSEQVKEVVQTFVKEHGKEVPDPATTPLRTVGALVSYVTPPLPWADDQNRVWTELTPVVGPMLKNTRRGHANGANGSRGERQIEGHAVMVVGRLTTDMMAIENVPILNAVAQLVDEARVSAKLPEGLEIGLSGSTLIGGDMQSSVQDSLKSTELTTIILVLLCLLLIYRAPLLVIIPMATIAVSLSVAFDVVALMADNFGPGDVTIAGYTSTFTIFTTTKIFVIVILFGAGTDFCLFLIARFKEELGLGTELPKAAGTAISHVGDALTASAFTTILGLATMFFAQYGKFVYSGPVVAICLFIALVASLTLAPAMLRAFGKFVFWPFGVETDKHDELERLPFDEQMKRISPLWDFVAKAVMRYPGVILWVSLGLSAVFIIEGLSVEVTHDFMNELADNRPTKQGTNLIREYFPPGETAPMTVMATLPEGGLNDAGNYDIAFLNTYLYNIPGVMDVRSLYKPRGGDPSSSENLTELTVASSPLAKSTFVSETGPYAGKVTQLHLVLDQDPFSREARALVDTIEEKLKPISKGEPLAELKPDWFAGSQQSWDTIREGMPAWKGATFELVGTSPAMRDLANVTAEDEVTIKILVVLSVLAVIMVILRRPIVCLYLILTVLLSYYATIGMTEMFFNWYYQGTFDGLDWKAPIFLFVILIAVGQDYNIYLTTRIVEEQAKLGPHRGLRKAMVQTGGIITSCGIIMAGTFVAMTSGTLRGMIELGFALSLGVLLDTFFVRTIVVPCFFSLLAGKEPKEETEAKKREAAAEGSSRLGSAPHHSHTSAVSESAS